MRLRADAVFKITAVSVISTMNVDRPRERLSDAPMRVKVRSIRGNEAEPAGTTEPIGARTAISAACRRYVDLQPMLGPVMIAIRSDVAARNRSFGMKRPDSCST